MADNTVRINLEVASKGMDPAVGKSQTIKDNLTAGAAAMGKVGAAAMGGTTGSQKAAGQTYTAQRGVAASTGASARNFAAESQGLGGVVRLYATFAANAYAASAAFTALSNAMDTSNMVKGLDQLGASSGRNLGTLSKQLVATTNGAISLQEAMRAVAQTTSAGMSSDNILKLGKVAEKASQALGISMPDAVNRLSRGIVKLEPELLDELGLFTKIDESNQKYAASLGKSANALTDFEKRQGFANAVLEEGVTKFGKIKIETNPYAQLTAALQNLAQSGLETVNTVLGPLVKLLASSPTALTTVVAGLAAVLVKQAIPAVGQYRQALQAASEKALLAVSGSTTASKAALAQKIAQTRQEAELLAEVEVNARDEATKKLQALQGGSFAKSRARLTPILDKPVQDVTAKELAYLEAQAAKNLTSNVKLAASYREVADTIITGQAAETRYAAIRSQEILAEQELANVSKARQLADKEYRKLSEAAIVRDINLKTAAAVKELGYVEALKLAYLEYSKARAGTTELEVPTGRSIRAADGSKVPELEKVSVPAISKTALAVGLLRSGITATATAVGGLISALSGWGAAAFIAYEIGSLVVEYLGNTTTESKATAAALDTLTESGKGVARTLEDIGTRSPFERLTVDSINARVTAFGELTAAMSETLKATNAEMSKMNWMDKIVDFTKGLVRKDLQSKTSETFAKSIQSAFAAAVPSDATSDLARSIEKILGTSITDIKGLEQAYKSMGGAASVEIQEVVANLAKLSQAQQVASARSVELRDSYKESYKALNTFMISALPSDPLSKIGQNMMADAGKLAEALKDPTQALVTMKALSSDINALKLFPPEVALQLSKYSEELNKLSYSSTTAEEDLQGLNKTIDALQQKKLNVEISLGKETKGSKQAERYDEQLNEIVNELDKTAKSRKIKLDVLADVKTRSKDIEGVFGDALRKQFVAGADILSAKIAAEWAKAGTTVSNAVAGLLGDSLTANKLRAENEKQVIRAQMQGVQSQLSLIIATDRLAAQIELSRASEKVTSTQQLIASGVRPGSAADEKAQKELTAALALEKKLTERIESRKGTAAEQVKGSGSSKAQIAKFMTGTDTVTREDINFAQMIESSLAQLAQFKADIKVVDITKIAKDLTSNAKLAQESLDRDKAGVQVQLDSLAILEAEGKILSNTQLTDKKLLEDQMSIFEYRQKISALDAKIAVEKVAQSALTEQIDKDTVQAGINLLNIDNRRILTNELLGKLGLGQAKLANTLETKARSLLAIETETAQIRASGALEGKTSTLDIDVIRLETLKATGKITEKEYTARKSTVELGAEDLDNIKTKLSLEQANRTKMEELDKRIDAEENMAIKTVLEEQQLALLSVHTQALINLDNLTDAKKQKIKEIADYEKDKVFIDGLTDAVIISLTKGGKEGSKKLREIITNALIEPVTITVRAIVSSVTNAVGNAAGKAGSSMLSSMGQSFAGSAGGKYVASSLGFEGSSFTAMGSAMAANFTGGFNAGLAGTGEAFMSTLGAANIEAGVAASSGTFGASAGVMAGEAGTMLLAAAPYLAAAALIANALGVFRTTKTTGSGLMGTLGSTEGLQSYDLTRTSGTLFKGPDYDLANVKTSELSDPINEAFKTYRNVTAELAEGLGLSSDAVKNFTTTLGKELIHGDHINAYGLKLEGLTPEQQMQKVQAALGVTTEDMAKLALGTDKYNKLNETSKDALQRLSTSLSLVNGMFKDLGFDLKEVGLEGADSASKLIDALGGAAAAQSKLGFVYDKFYTAEQKRANLTEKTTTALAKYNLELPKSREGYTALLDTASKLGAPEIFAALVNLAPAIDELLVTVEDNISLLADLADAEGNSAKATTLRRTAELKALSATDAAIKRRINALEDEKSAYDKLKSVLDSTVEGFETSIKSLRDFQTSILSGPQSFTSPEQQLATRKAQFTTAIAAARGPLTTEKERTAAAEAAQDAQKFGQQLIDTGNVLYASGQENVELRAMVAEQIGGVADVLQYAQTDAEKMLIEATVGNEYLKTISDNSIATTKLWDTYLTAKAVVPTELGIVTTQAPVSAVSENTQALNVQIAAQAETNRLLQKQLDLQAEQLRSNAIATQAQTDQLNAAAADLQAQADYNARNVPVLYYPEMSS